MVFIIFLALVLGLCFTLVKVGRFAKWAKLFRVLVVVFSISFFAYWFFERSVTRFLENSLSAQVISQLPQTLDFYIIKVEDNPSKNYVTKHIGKIRPEHFRLEYLKMKNSNEFWVVGYLGKNMLYFSQHSVPNKNMDQIIEANNYIIQSSKLAEIAKQKIEEVNRQNIGTAVWVTLDFLLLFLNLALLLFKRK